MIRWALVMALWQPAQPLHKLPDAVRIEHLYDSPDDCEKSSGQLSLYANGYAHDDGYTHGQPKCIEIDGDKTPLPQVLDAFQITYMFCDYGHVSCSDDGSPDGPVSAAAMKRFEKRREALKGTFWVNQWQPL